MYEIKQTENKHKELGVYKFLINYLERCKQYHLEQTTYNISNTSKITSIEISKEFKNKLYNLIITFEEDSLKNTNRVEISSYNYSDNNDSISTNYSEILENNQNYNSFKNSCLALVSQNKRVA